MLRLGQVGRRATWWGWHGCGRGWGVLGAVAQSRTLGQRCAHKSCRREAPIYPSSKRRLVERRSTRRCIVGGTAASAGAHALCPGLARPAVTRSNCADADTPEPYLGPEPDRFQLDFTKEKNIREIKCATSTEKFKHTSTAKPVIFLDHEIEAINYSLKARSWLPKNTSKLVPLYQTSKAPKSAQPLHRQNESPKASTFNQYTKPDKSTSYQPESEHTMSAQEMLQKISTAKVDHWKNNYTYKGNKEHRRGHRFNPWNSRVKDQGKLVANKNDNPVKMDIVESNEPPLESLNIPPVMETNLAAGEPTGFHPFLLVRKVSSIGEIISEQIRKQNFTKDWLINKIYVPKTDALEPVLSLDTVTIENDTQTTTNINATVTKPIAANDVNVRINNLSKTLQDIRRRLDEWKISSDFIPRKQSEILDSAKANTVEKNGKTNEKEDNEDDKKIYGKLELPINNKIELFFTEGNGKKIQHDTMSKDVGNIRYIPNSLANETIKSPWKTYMDHKSKVNSVLENREKLYTMINEQPKKHLSTSYIPYEKSKSMVKSISHNEMNRVNHRRARASVQRFPSAITFEHAQGHVSRSRVEKISSSQIKDAKRRLKSKNCLIGEMEMFNLPCHESPFNLMKEKLRNIGMNHLAKLPSPSNLLQQKCGIDQMRWLSTTKCIEEEKEKHREPPTSLYSDALFKESDNTDIDTQEKTLSMLFSKPQDTDDKENIQKQNKENNNEHLKEPITNPKEVTPVELSKKTATECTKPLTSHNTKPEVVPAKPSRWVVWNSPQGSDNDKLSHSSLDRRLQNASREIKETQERINNMRASLKKDKETERTCVNIADVGIGLSSIGAVVSPEKEEDALRGHCFQETMSKLQGKNKVNKEEADELLPNPDDGGRFIFSPGRSLRSRDKSQGLMTRKQVNVSRGRNYSTMKGHRDIVIHTYDSTDDSVSERRRVESHDVSPMTSPQSSPRDLCESDLGDDSLSFRSAKEHGFGQSFSNYYRNSLTDVNKLESGKLLPKKDKTNLNYSYPEKTMRPKFSETSSGYGSKGSSLSANVNSRRVNSQKSLTSRSATKEQVAEDSSADGNASSSDSWFTSFSSIKGKPRLSVRDYENVEQSSRQVSPTIGSPSKPKHEFVDRNPVLPGSTGEARTNVVEKDSSAGQNRNASHDPKGNDLKALPYATRENKDDVPYKQILVYKVDLSKSKDKGNLEALQNAGDFDGAESNELGKTKIKVTGKFESKNSTTVIARSIAGGKREDNEYTTRKHQTKIVDKMRPRFDPNSHIVIEEKKDPPKEIILEDALPMTELDLRRRNELDFQRREQKKVHNDIYKTVMAIRSGIRPNISKKTADNSSSRSKTEEMKYPLEPTEFGKPCDEITVSQPEKKNSDDQDPTDSSLLGNQSSSGKQDIGYTENNVNETQITESQENEIMKDDEEKLVGDKQPTQEKKEENEKSLHTANFTSDSLFSGGISVGIMSDIVDTKPLVETIKKAEPEKPFLKDSSTQTLIDEDLRSRIMKENASPAIKMDDLLPTLLSESGSVILENDENGFTKCEDVFSEELSTIGEDDLDIYMIDQNDLTCEFCGFSKIEPVTDGFTCGSSECLLRASLGEDQKKESGITETVGRIMSKLGMKENVEKVEAMKNASRKKEPLDCTKRLLQSLKEESEESMKFDRPRPLEKELADREKIMINLEEKVTRELNQLENDRKFEELKGKIEASMELDKKCKGPWTAQVPDGALPKDGSRQEVPNISADPSSPDSSGQSKDSPRYKLAPTKTK